MRRTRLIWFAIGAAVSLLATVISQAFFAFEEPSPDLPFLEMQEPFPNGDEIQDEDMIANVTGEIARNCGAAFFETTFLYDDHIPTVEIAINTQNAEAISCILAEANERSIQTNFNFRKANNAQTK